MSNICKVERGSETPVSILLQLSAQSSLFHLILTNCLLPYAVHIILKQIKMLFLIQGYHQLGTYLTLYKCIEDGLLGYIPICAWEWNKSMIEWADLLWWKCICGEFLKLLKKDIFKKKHPFRNTRSIRISLNYKRFV